MSVVLGVNQSSLTAKALQKAEQIAKARQSASDDPAPTPADLVLAIFALTEELSEGKVELASVETMKELRRGLADLAKKLAPQGPALLRTVVKKASAYSRAELIELGVKDDEQLESPLVDLGSLFAGCYLAHPLVGKLLDELLDVRRGFLGLGKPDLRPVIANIRTASAQAKVKREVGSTAPLLTQYSTDLTDQAERGGSTPTIGRKDEIRAVFDVLRKRSSNNPILLGEPGVGKTQIFEGLAEWIVTRKPEIRAFWDYRVVQLSLRKLLQEGQFVGGIESVVEELIAELAVTKTILCIDEAHALPPEFIEQTKQEMSRGQMGLVLATTLREYRQCIEPNEAFAQRVRIIEIGEPSPEETEAILMEGHKPKLEDHHPQVVITADSVKAAVVLAKDFRDERLPRSAVDTLEEAAAITESYAESKFPEGEQLVKVTPYAVAEAIHRFDTSLPRTMLYRALGLPGGRAFTIQEVARQLGQVIIGQREAIEAVAARVVMYREGLTSPEQPLGVSVFLGPTGVGKTELAKALAEFLFGSQDRMVRIDMSEYSEPHSGARWAGAPPGYVGYEEGGQLIEAVRRHSHNVVLLDEIEKAHGEVFDMLLQVISAARMTSGKGQTVSFRDIYLIMTSNAGAQEIIENWGNEAAMREAAMRGLKTIFRRPELISRLTSYYGAVLYFHPLSDSELSEILDLKIVRLQKERLDKRNLRLVVDDSARKRLFQKGYNRQYGARPLDGAIDGMLIELADNLAKRTISMGQTLTITVSANSGGYVFR